MVGNSNLIEETVELSNNCGNLRGQVAGIHDRRAQKRVELWYDAEIRDVWP